MEYVKSELKIAGINPVLILAFVVAVFTFLSVIGGELLFLSDIGFEVVFPIFTAIAVSEWGRFKSDDNFDIIVAQCRSLFGWVSYRFIAVFAEAAGFAVTAMLLVFAVRREMPLWEMACLYFPPAFFLSTVSVLFGVCFSQEHVATLCCGMVWLSALMARSLLQVPGVGYVYPFIRYAGDPNGIWLMNKGVLCAASLLLWGVILWKTSDGTQASL